MYCLATEGGATQFDHGKFGAHMNYKSCIPFVFVRPLIPKKPARSRIPWFQACCRNFVHPCHQNSYELIIRNHSPTNLWATHTQVSAFVAGSFSSSKISISCGFIERHPCIILYLHVASFLGSTASVVLFSIFCGWHVSTCGLGRVEIELGAIGFGSPFGRHYRFSDGCKMISPEFAPQKMHDIQKIHQRLTID